jgi:very-short-patch-repair endonuclease
MPSFVILLLSAIGALALLAVAAVVFHAFLKGYETNKPTIGEPTDYPYEREANFLSAAERSFLGVLDRVTGEDTHIFAKVRLADVLRVRRGLGPRDRQKAFNRVQSKHVDFVVCDASDLSIQFVVELDDSSHMQTRRQKRDAFVNQAFAAAGIPLFRFPAKRTYAVHDVQSRILSALSQGPEEEGAP